MWAVETRGLTKTYGPIQSLVDCNLQIPSGCVFGLLGPNGAGKTTLLRTLLGFLEPSSGTAAISGYDIATHSLQARRQVSYLPGDARLYRSLRGGDLIRMFCGLHPYGSVDASLTVARRLDLELTRRVMFMSTGMRQKLALAIVLGCQAPLVVLDEPTANLDPNVRSEVVELIKEARLEGRTVILSSHIFSDIDDACDRVVIMRSGRVVAEQDMQHLEQLHIVRGKFPKNWSLADRLRDCSGPEDKLQFSDLLMEQPFIDWVLPPVARQEDASSLAHENVELHLKGSPNTWLRWLEGVGLDELQIEKAGIRSIYQRHHRAP